ncbi:Uncharacterised protein [Pasteurella multocida]|uniref:Tetratricopeptide repeat protein n=1 Tax=Pasteurella dagmatis ATCC 43325 TaxID=667128 RepID=C9PMI6_9PAST|nr:hypothetical protein [Pasteurella dagmatis]EEX51406.1 hypothetical protein HMPREF0621_0210 [Pasteurella dagmatis ATCC 43325]SNV41578.1 Uncharacterised protein [Pasteurella dagmatis]VEI57041.1 Uncharacterised protein [Pasteurella multocida]
MEWSDIIVAKYKEMFNMAYVLIEQEKYEAAECIYNEVITLSDLVQYQESKRMAYICLTNLMVLQKRMNDALICAINARNFSVDMEQIKQADELIKSVSLTLLKQGIEFERVGKYVEAYHLFQLIYPYLSSKRQEVVKQEMAMLAKHIAE